MSARAPARRRSRIAVAALVAAVAAGCGPVTSVQTIADANTAIAAAQGVEADRYAVFEYVSAVEYLKKAKEEEGYSDFQTAVNLARQAKELAEKARARALASPARGTLRPATDNPADAPLDEDLGETPPGSHL